MGCFDLRRDATGLEREQGENGLECSGGTERMADRGFRGDEARLGVFYKNPRERRRLGAVIERRSRAVGIDVADIGWLQLGLLQRSADAQLKGRAGRVGLGDVVRVGRVAVADDAALGLRSARGGVCGAFDHQKGGPLAEHETAAVYIEWTDVVRRERLKAIEAAENQFTERLEPSRQHDVSESRTHEIGGVADGIRPARAGIRDNHRGTGEAETLLEIGDLLLGGIARDADGLMAKTPGPHALEKGLAELHAVRCGAERHFQTRKNRTALGIQNAGVHHGLARGGEC